MDLLKDAVASERSLFVPEGVPASRPGQSRALTVREFGNVMRLGFVAQLCLAASDVDAALAAACLYSPLWSRRGFRYERGEEGAVWVRALAADDDDARRIDAVSTIATWCRLASDVSGASIAPIAVHAPAGARAVLRELMSCPIHEADDDVAICFARVDVRRENPSADEHLHAVLESFAAQRLADAVEGQSTRERLRRLLAQQTDVSEARAERIGRELGVGVRTLHRRLKAEGTSFRKVLDEFRLEHGMRQLASSRASAKEVAYALGFSDPASFHRAFKRWTGSTVSEYRQNVRAPQARSLEAKAS